MITLTYIVKWRFHSTLTSPLLKVSNAAWVNNTNLWFLKKLWFCVGEREKLENLVLSNEFLKVDFGKLTFRALALRSFWVNKIL